MGKLGPNEGAGLGLRWCKREATGDQSRQACAGVEERGRALVKRQRRGVQICVRRACSSVSSQSRCGSPVQTRLSRDGPFGRSVKNREANGPSMGWRKSRRWRRRSSEPLPQHGPGASSYRDFMPVIGFQKDEWEDTGCQSWMQAGQIGASGNFLGTRNKNREKLRRTQHANL